MLDFDSLVAQCESSFLRNINEATTFSFTSALPVAARVGKGPIFEGGPGFESAFKLFHGRDGINPLSGRSYVPDEKQNESIDVTPEPALLFNPFGPFGFDFINNGKGKRQNKKPNNLDQSHKNAKTPDQSSMKVKDNEYEKRIRESVISAGETGVTFDDIGALDDIKKSIEELVMLPLRRPDLFKGDLLKPCRGILLFGPPGTGKTMLAKAIANEAGASFINISFSSIASKWYGEGEKSIRALFSLARKIAPAIIFLDEVDSMLGTRTNSSEHEVSRRIMTEFMTHWDGLLSKSNEKVLVLAATNRPFDLDEAIIRRFEHRIMVGLPTLESRELILKKLLSKEKVENIDFKELARLTEGYSGSDLKNLCVEAAYHPLRELLQKEKEKKVKDKQVVVKDEQAESSQKGGKVKVKDEQVRKEKVKSKKRKADKVAEGETEGAVALRPLNMEDLKHAKDQISASCASEGPAMNDIKQWNELYGKGGSRKKQQLTYFL